MLVQPRSVSAVRPLVCVSDHVKTPELCIVENGELWQVGSQKEPGLRLSARMVTIKTRGGGSKGHSHHFVGQSSHFVSGWAHSRGFSFHKWQTMAE